MYRLAVWFFLVLAVVAEYLDDGRWKWSLALTSSGLAVGMYLWVLRKSRDIPGGERMVWVVAEGFLSGNICGHEALGLLLLFSVMLNWTPSYLREKAFAELTTVSSCFLAGLFFLYAEFLDSLSRRKNDLGPHPERRRILIRALSFAPSGNEIEGRKNYLEILQKADCEEILETSSGPLRSLAPLFRAIQYHLAESGPLEKVYLLVSRELARDHPDLEVALLNRQILDSLREKITSCFGRDLVVYVEEDKGLDFEKFHPFRDSFGRFMENLLKRHDTREITIDISGGTSSVSAALILYAVKGHIQAQYLSQKDGQTFYRIDTDVFDLTDLIAEFSEKLGAGIHDFSFRGGKSARSPQ